MACLKQLADEYGDGAEGDTMRKAHDTIADLEAQLSQLQAENKWLQNEHVRVCSSESKLQAENKWLKEEKALIFGVVNFSYSHGKLCPSLPCGRVTPDTYNPEASQKAIDKFFSTGEVNSDE
jgi:FtsZ-binding cell division protein ZapB